MKEAKITCTCSRYYIQDLNKKVSRDEFFWLSEEEVFESKDLLRAQKIGAVKITWINRFRNLREPMTKYPPPPFVANYRPPLSQKQIIPEPTPPPIKENELIDNAEQVRIIIAEELSKFRVELMNGLQILISQVGVPMTLDDESIKKIAEALPLQNIVHSEASLKKYNKGPSGTDIFIPSDIVRVDGGTELNIESSSEDGNVDDALAALRSLKKK